MVPAGREAKGKGGEQIVAAPTRFFPPGHFGWREYDPTLGPFSCLQLFST